MCRHCGWHGLLSSRDQSWTLEESRFTPKPKKTTHPLGLTLLLYSPHTSVVFAPKRCGVGLAHPMGSRAPTVGRADRPGRDPKRWPGADGHLQGATASASHTSWASPAEANMRALGVFLGVPLVPSPEQRNMIHEAEVTTKVLPLESFRKCIPSETILV